MRRLTSITLGMILSAVTAVQVSGQWNVARGHDGGRQVYAAFGLDPALAATVGYGHVASLRGHPFRFTGDVSVVTAHRGTRDFRVRLGTETSVVRWRSLHFTGRATAIARGTENSIYRGFNFGADLTGAVGLYRPKWFASAEFGKDKAVITHITHSEWYRTNFYPDARDGWYLDAGGTFHTGLAGGYTLGRIEAVGSFGWRWTEDFNDVTPPLYAALRVGFSL